MFTRNSERETPPGIPASAAPPAQAPANHADSATPAPPPLRAAANKTAAASNSVIGRDLTIIGTGLKIVSNGLLQVDGEVQGDVVGQKIIIGQTGKVTGLVNAEEIRVEGSVYGTIKAVDVQLTASSVVEGDLYHQSFALEQGASFEGRSRRAETRDELVPDLAALAPPK